METPVPIKILEQPNRFVQIPRFWIDSLMKSKCYQPGYYANGKKRNGNRIPGSFWLYTFYLWRCIADGNKQRMATIALRQFPVRSDAAVLWTAAYAVSGLFDIQMGKYTSEHDEPTQFAYRVNATNSEWESFIIALDFTLNQTKHEVAELKGKFDPWGSTGAFKVALALNVDKNRSGIGLKPVNKTFLDDAVAERETDGKGRRIAKMDGDRIVPVFYSKQRRQRADESDEEFEERLDQEHCYGPDWAANQARQWAERRM